MEENRQRAVCPHCGAPLTATLEILAREVPLYQDGEVNSHAGFSETKSFRVFCSGCDDELDESEYTDQVEAYYAILAGRETEKSDD